MTRPAHTLTRLAAALLAAGCCALAASCTVGPDYRRPDVSPSGAFKSPSTQPATTRSVPRDWWMLFNDPTLTQLENQAAVANTDLQAAVARVAQARAQAKSAFGDFLPTLVFDPSIDRARAPANSAGVSGSTGAVVVPVPTTGQSTSSARSITASRTRTTTRVPFDLTYELDVWGRVRRNYEAAEAQVRSVEADREVVLQTIQADVATNYFSLRALDLQQQIFEKTVQSYRRQVELATQQFKAGTVGRLDVAQAQAQLSGTLAQQSDIARQRTDVEHALAVLLGKTPAELDMPVRPLDMVPPVVPPGMPADVIRRRPDVAGAEQNLIAANAQVGSAVAAFYPSLQLTGSAGFESFDVRHALDWEQRVWSLGAGLTLPLFEGGKLEAAEQQARARYDELLATYRGTILAAVRDVEDSLTDLRLRAEQSAAQDEAVRASREYVDLAQRQYKQGIIGYLTVIDAERTLLSNEVTAAQLLNQRLTSTVLLIKSLGGGWEAADATASR